MSVSTFAQIVLAKCVNFLLLVCFLQEQDWLCTHTTSIVLWQTAYISYFFARALSLKRAQASYTRPNYIALGHITLGHTTLISNQCLGALDVEPTSCWRHFNKSDRCSLVQEGWLTWVQGKKQQSIKTMPTWMQAHYSLFKTDTLQSHQHSLDARILQA